MTYFTVKVAFNNNTPSFAQDVKLPLFGILNPGISDANSLKIFLSDGGIPTPS